jgi:hypothetical protein
MSRRHPASWPALVTAAAAAAVAAAVPLPPAGAAAAAAGQPFGPRSAAWRAYYTHPHSPSAERGYCAGGGGRERFVVLGVPACGPAGNRLIDLPSPAHWTVQSPGFQCVELVDRYLYVRHRWLAPAGARPVDGAQTAAWYARHHRAAGAVLLRAGVPGHVPAAGDVMSMSETAGFGGIGHTALVVASRIGGDGDGTVTVAGENVSVDGRQPTAQLTVLSVRRWRISAFGFRYVEWLHLPTR